MERQRHMRSLAAIGNSASLSSSSSEVAEAKQQMLSYALRENPKKSFILVDPEFSIAEGCSAVVGEDWESETESSPPPERRRSRRLSPPKSDPASSVSETTSDEDVARCLMMLSRDVWIRSSFFDGEESGRVEDRTFRRPGRGKYQCGTCGKVFRSYQALGGHRASHKKLSTGVEEDDDNGEGQGKWGNRIHGGERRIHECPVCFRVFSSGQALGGHKRSHLATSSCSVARAPSSLAVACTYKLSGESLLDLNEPPPADEEEEISDVSEEQVFE